MMQIRLADINDLSQINDIYNQTIATRMVTADIEPITIEERTKSFQEYHCDSNRPLWVMADSNKIAGWLSFKSYYGRPGYRHTVEMSVYVGDGYRRQGISKKLIQNALGLAPELDIHTILGFVFKHNTPSISMLEYFDFIPLGHLPEVVNLDGIWRDVLIYGHHVQPL